MKIKKIILPIVLIVCVGLLAGAVYLFNDIYPKAKPIRHPELNEIVSVKLSCNTPDATIPMSEQYYEDLIRYIIEAKPTRKQALDDYPTFRPYYGVDVQTEEGQYRYYMWLLCSLSWVQSQQPVVTVCWTFLTLHDSFSAVWR